MREEFDTPTTQDIRQWRLFLASQPKRSKDARRCFSGSENDWKRMIRSLENPGVYENPCAWGSYAAGTGAFLMCGHHFVQHEEDVGTHLPSLGGFPQKVRVNVKNVFLLCKGPKSPAIKGVSELSYDWKCLFSPVWQNFGENMTFVSFHSGHVVMMLFLKLQILCKAWYCSTLVCVSKAYNLNFFLLQFFLVILVIRTPGVPLRN